MKNSDECPLCGSKNCSVQPNSERVGYELIRCKNCFTYNLHKGVTLEFNQANEDIVIKRRLNAIYEFLLKKPMFNFKGMNYYFFFYFDNEGVSENPLFINVNLLLNTYPKSLPEKTDRILLNFALKYPNYGDIIDRNYMQSGFYFCEGKDNETEINAIYKFLHEYGYYNKEASILTAKAWERIDELQKDDSLSRQAFVAMWFPMESDSKYSFMKDIRESIRKAIAENGYSTMIIDEKQHNNQIVPELIFEIKNSKFLVADITGHRNGVYYEAGIMEGLGRQVIVCCEESDFNNKHFDIAQKNLIKYKTAEDLYQKLVYRIKATIGESK